MTRSEVVLLLLPVWAVLALVALARDEAPTLVLGTCLWLASLWHSFGAMLDAS